MFPLRPALLTAGCALVAVALATPVAQAAPKSLKGTITWTTTATYGPKEGTDSRDVTTGTERTQVTLKAAFTRRTGAYGWQVENNGTSSFTGSHVIDRRTEERDFDGNLTCVITAELNAKGGGKIPKRASSSPTLSATKTGGPLSGPGGVLVLGGNLRYKGMQTTTYAGQGIAPCQSGQDNDPVEGSLAPGNDARRVCVPSGAKKSGLAAGNLVGTWKASKRAYAFSCTQKWSEPENGMSYQQTVTGSLKAS